MKATKTQIQMRVDDLITFRLDGARYWHVRQYVTEKERDAGSIWYRGENAKPHSDATLWRYIRLADKHIANDTRSSRKKRIRVHIAKRQNLYAKAIAKGDLRTALAAADSEAKLLGLLTTENQIHLEHGGKIQHEHAGGITIDVDTDEFRALPQEERLRRLRESLDTIN